MLLAMTLLPATIASADDLLTAQLQIRKTVLAPASGVLLPGDSVTYQITFNCSDANGAGCVNAVLTDPVPAPLVVTPGTLAVSGVGTNWVNQSSGNTVQIAVQQALGTSGTIGLLDGRSASVTFQATLPATVSADWDETTATNTASFAADNAIVNPVTWSAPVTLAVTPTLLAALTKTANPTTTPNVPGNPVTFTLTASNASNRSVDSLVVRDTAESATTNPFDYLALEQITSLTAPAGADLVAFDWRDAGNVWHTGTPVAIPTNPSDLLAGIDLPQVTAVVFTFSSSADPLPPTPAGEEGVIVLGAVVRDNVDNSGPVEILNAASAQVLAGGSQSALAPANATVTVTPSRVGPSVQKSFTPTAVNSGQTATVKLQSQNGDFPIVEMSVTEPQAGTLDLVQQGLTFQGFVDAQIAWPVGATDASIQYSYSDSYSEGPKTVTAVDIDTIPGPTPGHVVTGFHVIFTGDMQGGEYATLPFTVVAASVTEDTTLRNFVFAEVLTADSQSGETGAFADLTRKALRINTTIDKTATPSDIFGVAGSVVRVNLLSTVKAGDGPVIPGPPDDPNLGSTVGVESLLISDPPVGPTGGTVDPFWDSFDLTGIPLVAVPNNATLSVQYWNGSDWIDLPGAESVDGPQAWSTSIPGALRPEIQGIRFLFVANASDADGLLQPGFVVQPHLDFAVRSMLRSDPAVPVIDNSGTDTVSLVNHARSTVENPAAAVPVVSRDDAAGVTVKPFDGSGTGVDFIQKGWVTPDGSVSYTADSQVVARTGSQVATHLAWTTGGLPLTTMTLSEPAAPAPLDGSYLDAFDIVGIKPITSTLDPQLKFDAVVGVYRYSVAAGDWVDVTAVVCGADGSACDGAFPGYSVHVGDRDDTTGVRLVFAESPTRASRITGPGDPAVGSGVASSSGSRGVAITFQLRDTLRSDPSQAVLGSIDYNLTGSPGYVNNTANATGIVTDGPIVSDDDSAKTWIIDVPKNVSVEKHWDQNVVGIPQSGTPQEEFPIATVSITATNETAAKVDQLVVEDPAADSPVTPQVHGGTFDVFNLYGIRSISVPVGATNTTVTLTTTSGPLGPLSVAAALALLPADLQDVIGVSVDHTGRIDAGAATEIVLDVQLRAINRGSGVEVVAGDPALNTVKATVVDPGGTLIDTNEAWDDDATVTAQPSYKVTVGKSISPNERSTTDPDRDVTVRLSGKPDRDPALVGTAAVRTTTLVIADATPTFFNAYTFTGFSPIVLPAPVQQVKVEVLAGIDYALDSGTLVAECAGDTDLSDCWEGTGTWLTPSSGTTVSAAQLLANLPSGVAPADVQGLRFTFERTDGSNWERPYNPTVVVAFTADRRDYLRYGIGGAADTPVPSTRPSFEPAPGETARGTTTNVVDVVATGSWGNGASPWVADGDASATTVLRHQLNSIKVEKSPKDAVLPGQDIPFTLKVTNTGAWPMAGLTLVDTIQGDGNGPLLSPAVRDVDDTTPVYTFGLRNGAGATMTVPVITPVVAADGLTIDFELEPGFVLQPGYVLTITAAMRYRDDLQAGSTADNAFTASNDRVFDVCEYTDRMVLQPRLTVVDGCTATTQVYSLPASPIQVTKGVKGDGAGVLGADAGSANYNDLGVLASSGAPTTNYCATPNALEGFYRAPCVPITRPGGEEVWKIWFKNSGNIPVQVLSAIDVLPANNDRGVIINQARSSRWAPTFLGDVTFSGLPVGGAAQLLYLTAPPTTVCNRLDILNDTKPGGIQASDVNPGGQFPGETIACLTDVAARAWLPYDESLSSAAKASIAALKVVVNFADGAGLAASQTVALQYRTATAAYAQRAETTDRESIAWNSTAVGSRGIYIDGATTTYQVGLVAEARKTGIAMATGKVQFSKLVTAPTGWTAPLPTQYTFTVGCTSLGQSVPLRDTAGAAITSLTLKANGTVVTYNNGLNSGQAGFTNWSQVNVPLYATCSLTEAPTQGAVVTFEPSSAVALRDFATRTDVYNPAWPSVIPLNGVGAENTYSLGGFSISKSVDAGGAVNAAGSPIEYNGPFAFSATCKFLGNEVLPTGQRTFSVTPGIPVTIANLPAGSTCTVTEGNANGADRAGTEIAVTTGAGAAPLVTGKSVSFTVTANTAAGALTNSVAVTNTFPVGSATITKAFSGAGEGAWGSTMFTMRLVCTLSSATPSTVFDGTKNLTKADPLWTVNNLATGATCTTTETALGGANSNTITPPVFIVGSGTNTDIVVTNSFTTGSLRVTKALSGQPAASLSPATGDSYEVTAVCQRVVNGLTVSITVPGGATRTISAPLWYADYTGLPTGATCVVSETDAGYATSTSILPTGGGATVGNSTVVTVAVTNSFANGSLELTKALTGEGSEFAPDSFGAVVTCTWHGAAVDLPDGGRVVLRVNETTLLTDIPVGSSCSVAEDDEGQTSSISVPSSATITASAASAARIAVTNDYSLAALRVDKSVLSSALPMPTDFEFTATCTYLGKTVLSETFKLNDGGARDFGGLPTRATCIVQETDARMADGTITGVSVTDPSSPPVLDQSTRTATIPELSPDSTDPEDGPTNVVSYTNLFGVGGITVTKALKGEGAAQFGTEKIFTAAIVCVFEGETLINESRALSETNGFTTSITDIVAGAVCTVTEPSLKGADAVVFSPSDGIVTMPTDDVAAVTITNWFLTGSLKVTKLFAGDGADKFGTADYEVQLECKRDGIAVLIPDGDMRTVTAAKPLATYANLPTGASCVLSEIATGSANSTRITDATGVTTLAADATTGYTFTVETNDTILDVADQPQPALGVENTFNFARVSVTKTVESVAVDAAGAVIEHGPFTVALACYFDGSLVHPKEPDSRQVAAGDTVEWTQLPEGADCTVTETNAMGAAWTTLAVTQGGSTAEPIDGRTVALAPLQAIDPLGTTVENRVDAVNGYESADLTVRKVVEGTDAASITRTFPVTVECTLIDETHPAPGLLVRNIGGEIGGPDDLTIDQTDLPAGATCVVTETDAGGANHTTVAVDGGPSALASSVTVDLEPGVTSAAQVLFTNTFDKPLVNTGLDVRGVLAGALVLLLSGTVVFVVARRRGRSTVALR